jgi:predicted RNA-binding Zn ribbon-like protein
MIEPTRVRFGGTRIRHGYVFELTGGRLCLDLANTVDERGRARPRELLTSYRDLLDWSRQSGIVSQVEARRLRARAAANPASAERALRRIRAAREVVFGVFSAAARGLPVPARLLRALNRLLAEAARRRVVEPDGRRFRWGWKKGGSVEPDHILRLVVWSGAELIASDELGRVRQCEGAGCAWLFIDTSRNASRRWCDMSVCGNRAKAKRHYAKSRAATASAAPTT